MTVWKVGSRWSDDGNKSSLIIDIFRKYQIVFVGRKQKYFSEMKVGDLLAIADGERVVGVSEILENPKVITDFQIDESDKISGRFAYEEWVVGCKVKMYALEAEDYFKYTRGTFHKSHNEYKDKVKSLYQKYSAGS